MEEKPTAARAETIAESPWLTIKQAASRIQLAPGTLRNYMSRGLIPFHRNPLTGTVRLRVDEVDAWLTCGNSGICSDESR